MLAKSEANSTDRETFMQTVERQSLESKLENIGNVLRLTVWIGLAAKIGFGAVALLLVIFATAGRSFSQATALLPGAAGIMRC